MIIVLIKTSATAQFVEAGAFAGVTNYLGDLAPVAFIPGESHPAFGGCVKFNFSKLVDVKFGAYNGTISGSDARNNFGADFRIRRNLSFKSNITEASIMGELNLFGFRTMHSVGRRVSPFVEAGVGLFYHNPKAEYNGQWFFLQPLGTEGQGLPGYPKPYKLVQVAFPIGLGIKVALNKHWNITADMAFRKTTTDYLDDVSTKYADSTMLALYNSPLAAELADRSGEVLGENYFKEGKGRGDPNNKDWYFFPGVTVSYTFIHELHGKKSVGHVSVGHCFSRFHR